MHQLQCGKSCSTQQAWRGTERSSASRRSFSAGSGRMAMLCGKSANRSRLAAGAIGKLDRAETENRTSISVPSAEVRAGIRKSE
jgi:hypothetical protein